MLLDAAAESMSRHTHEKYWAMIGRHLDAIEAIYVQALRKVGERIVQRGAARQDATAQSR